jgi:MoxR-like ATPase
MSDESSAIIKAGELLAKLRTQIGNALVGQDAIVEQTIIALIVAGHVLIEGVPGLGKTLLVRALAQAMTLSVARIQFTPDLMPSDITGHAILDPGSHELRIVRGPVFTHMLLADEINRAPAKTQSALLEVMQEYQVTLEGQTLTLPRPFTVLATQNPLETEGTYPLPEAQLDRFMFSVKVGYPSAEEEERIIMETTQDASQEVDRVLGADALLGFQHLVRKTPVSRHVGAYATRLVRATRPDAPDAPDFIKNWVRWGAGPRAGQYLILAAKSHALLQGRLNVSCDDVRSYALPVLRHRVLCNFAAASEGVDSDEIIRRLVEAIPEPDYARGD